MLAYAPGWSLASQFRSYTPPQKNSFSAAKKNENFKGYLTHPLLKKISDTHKKNILFWLFLSKILSRRSRLLRTTSDPARKSGTLQAKIAFFLRFSGENFGTILSRRSRLSRTSRTPSRLIRPRLIDCDRRSEQTVKNFPVSGQFCFRTSTSPKKSFLIGSTIY